MHLRSLPRRSLALLLLGTTVLAGCQAVGIEHRVRPLDATRFDTPVRAHLIDGRTVVFRQGVRFESNAVLGGGTVYGLRLDSLDYVLSVPLDSVAAMESIHQTVNGTQSALLSALGLAAVIAVVVAIAAQDMTFSPSGPGSGW